MKIASVDPAIGDLFGTVAPPPGTPSDPNPVNVLSRFLSVGIQIIFVVAALAMLLYLFLGAFDWIASAGEKEKLVKAQQKIINAVVGMILVIAAFTIFLLVNQVILGNQIFQVTPNGFKLIIPTVAP